MCGKFCSFNSFNPFRGLDIYAVEVKGLGRGKGVKVVNRYSILKPENEVAAKIGNRLLELLTLFLEEGCLDPYDIYKILPEDYRDEVITEYVDEVDELQGSLAECQELVEELSEGMIE